jgi:methanogenic corrinoid protein MtbC1
MADDEIILSELSDDELVQQMHDDLYDGLKEEIEEGTNILLERGWVPYKVLTEALVEGMRIVGEDSATASCSCRKCCFRPTP